ncbi:MAG: TonB-dependent receptor [Pseudomonadota bacterium]
MAPMKRACAGLLMAALAAPVAVYAQVTYPFNLPAQALSKSLRQVGSQARINVIFDPAAIGARQAPSLKGSYEPKQALSRLLAGTGFTAEFTDATTVVIKPRTGPTPNTPDRPQERRPLRAAAPPVPATLDKITVLGSLIPRSKIETASPLIVITAGDIKNRGFSSVADALQNLTVNTGSINNTAINTGDIWAAKTVSLFGLDPSYTKFLIDGRPMPLFSQVAQTTTVDQLYTNLSGIPIDLVERIEILPGGQSSLYGSDAIAGVVNIVLKKHVNVATVDARYGWYSDGGGRERMLSFTNSFDIGKLNLMVGAQVSDQKPMWAFQRSITAQNFAGGINPQQPNQNVYAQGLFYGLTYFPSQPSDCSKLAGLFGGSERYSANSFGAACGSTTSNGYQTLINKDQSASFSVHADYAINDRVQLYADFLDNYEQQSHRVDNLFFAYIFDPNLFDEVFIEKEFAPEEISSNLDDLLSQKSYENTYQGTFGGKVDFGRGWNLDVAFTRSLESDDDRQIGLLANDVPGSYGSVLLGPYLGDFFGVPMYSPNYSLLANPVTPAQYASYLGAASINSSNRNDQLRAQLTQTSLFTLPGGNAGLAIVAEEGYETWKYLPSPLLTAGTLQGIAWNPSDGHRSRYATAAELNLPLFKMLTVDLSARYDSYDAEGAHFSHPTYALGLEFRPIQTLLLRGKYSTSFKAPSLIDQFEGGSTGPGYVTDWGNCYVLTGNTLLNISNCPPQLQYPATVVQESNPALNPMTSKNFSYGFVWAPDAHLSMSLDYQHISIRNEVLKENPDSLGQEELYCLTGTLSQDSPTCQAVDAQIIRGPATSDFPLGPITEVVTKKINIAHEVNNALNASFAYRTDPHAWGYLDFNLGWTRVKAHRQQQFPGDPVIDFLNNPGFSTEFQTKANASLTWTRKKWSATLYGTYFGPTPNYIAQMNDGYTAPYAGKVAAWRIYNASINYSPTFAWQLSLRVNNIKNSMPPLDVTYPGSTNQPFNVGNYNPYGRELFVEARYRFGRGDNH